MKRYRHLDKKDRIAIETLLNRSESISTIADTIGVNRSTIYRELKNGTYYKRQGNYRKKSYSSEIAQDAHEAKVACRGVRKKISRDSNLLHYIENKIAFEHYSPEAVLGEIKAKNLQFKETICISTLYSYIDKGVFAYVTNDDLPVKKNKKREYKTVKPTRQHKNLKGKSIEERPKEVLDREEFGHWEMDTVVGRRHSKASLLVFTERVTRKEIIIKLKDHTAMSVVHALDTLERRYGDMFPKIFKTITCDNGTEFSKADLIERSCLHPNEKRTDLYYCHPYTSNERGSNENANRLIRKFYPKGTSFDEVSDYKITKLENWMNNYPRKLLNYRCANDLYNELVVT